MQEVGKNILSIAFYLGAWYNKEGDVGRTEKRYARRRPTAYFRSVAAMRPAKSVMTSLTRMPCGQAASQALQPMQAEG